MTAWSTYESPLGPLTLTGGPGGLRRLHFPDEIAPLPEEDHDDAVFTVARRQLTEYFAGRRTSFELGLDLEGTPFQRQVWGLLAAIPYGTTQSYSALARLTGRIDRVRAVGAAVGRTPVPIIVPCHRAVGANGALTGYSGGLDRKRALLDLELSAARHIGVQ